MAWPARSRPFREAALCRWPSLGDQVSVLQENESTYIPVGTKHRLANPGKVPLELIEVQCGGYLREDDITRFDDQYGRTG